MIPDLLHVQTMIMQALRKEAEEEDGRIVTADPSRRQALVAERIAVILSTLDIFIRTDVVREARNLHVLAERRMLDDPFFHSLVQVITHSVTDLLDAADRCHPNAEEVRELRRRLDDALYMQRVTGEMSSGQPAIRRQSE